MNDIGASQIKADGDVTRGVIKKTRRVVPLGPRVIVRITSAPEKIGSLYVPDSAKQKPNEGVVTALGEGKRLDDGTLVPPPVKVGDVVQWGKFGGNTLEVDGQDLFSIHQDEIVARIEEV